MEPHILKYFCTMKDHRIDRSKMHSLSNIIFITIAATLYHEKRQGTSNRNTLLFTAIRQSPPNLCRPKNERSTLCEKKIRSAPDRT